VIAADRERSDILKWLRAQNPPCEWNLVHICELAILLGDVDVLKRVMRLEKEYAALPLRKKRM
jgi:hypothetical protein